MENMIVLNTVAELREFLDNTGLDTLVNRVAFASDEVGYVVNDFAVN